MRRSLLAAAGLFAAVSVLVLLLAWALRFQIASSIVDRTLAQANVRASYRLVRLAPFHERIEDVRIGDPAHPDLIARRIDLMLGYDRGAPSVRGIAAEGVRLRAGIDGAGLHLGALDRLLPKSKGGTPELPDMDVRLRDTELALATPQGTVRARLAGSGNPARRFIGHLQADAPSLLLSSCAIRATTASLRIDVVHGVTHLAGPVGSAAAACGATSLGAGGADVTASLGKAFDRVSLRADFHGFGGRAGPARFGSVGGRIEAAGPFDALAARATLAVTDLALDDTARAVARAAGMLDDTPLAPTGQRAAAAFARLLRGSELTVELAAVLAQRRLVLDVGHAALAGKDGASVTATKRGGMGWSAAGWRVDADLATGGGVLPALRLQLRQPAPGAPLTGAGRLAPYRAGDASLAVPALRFAWDGRTAGFDTVVRVDGPVPNGFVRGLAIPLNGRATRAGGLVLGRGCQLLAFRELRLAAFTFDGASLPVCGRPLLARSARGGVRFDAATGPILLVGRNAAGDRVRLAAAGLRLKGQEFSAGGIDASIGSTRLAVARLEGRFRRTGPEGGFETASGAIANVPLAFAASAGHWRLADGALKLGGHLQVSDASAAPRFNPLVADDGEVSLRGGLVTAAATLHEPTTHDAVARLTLTHDLSSGVGASIIDVPGIRFAPAGLQPEMLTPLTLGVIANVAGRVTGGGRIAWDGDGVTSVGTFETDRLDLAAAFGPVSGIAGRIRFTDLLGLVTAPRQEVTIAVVNPGVIVADGIVHYQLVGQNRIHIEDAAWPFAAGILRLLPATLDLSADKERRLTFRLEGLDAAHFIQQLEFPNVAATGTFDGVLPMIFDAAGGRIEGGTIMARPGGGKLAYVGELTTARLGATGKLVFDALKAIRYSALDIRLDGRLDGEMVSLVRFAGVREATPGQSMLAGLIDNLPFRFNIAIRAPFRGLVGSARAYADPQLLLHQTMAAKPAPPVAPVQVRETGAVR